MVTILLAFPDPPPARKLPDSRRTDTSAAASTSSVQRAAARVLDDRVGRDLVFYDRYVRKKNLPTFPDPPLRRKSSDTPGIKTSATAATSSVQRAAAHLLDRRAARETFKMIIELVSFAIDAL